MSDVLYESEIDGLRLAARGKVRDTYDLGDALLIVATDRLSAFDVVLPTPIPEKGRVLTELSRFWFERTGAPRAQPLRPPRSTDIAPAALRRAPARGAADRRPQGEAVADRSASCAATSPAPAGRSTGSDGTVCGMRCRRACAQADQLPEPIFTPTTKADGRPRREHHLRPGAGDGRPGRAHVRGCATASPSTTTRAAYARERGIIIADTKFEFGVLRRRAHPHRRGADARLVALLAASDYRAGRRRRPASTSSTCATGSTEIGWNKEPPAPALPPDVVQKTSEKYLEALRRLT